MGLVILSALSANMFKKGDFGCFKIIAIKDEQHLKDIVKHYTEIISYHRHEPTLRYLKTIMPNIKNADTPEFVYDGKHDLLIVSLAKRLPKGVSGDVEIKGFDDLAILLVHESMVGVEQC